MSDYRFTMRNLIIAKFSLSTIVLTLAIVLLVIALIAISDRIVTSDPYSTKYKPKGQESLLDGKSVLPDPQKIDFAHTRKDPILKDSSITPIIEP